MPQRPAVKHDHSKSRIFLHQCHAHGYGHEHHPTHIVDLSI